VSAPAATTAARRPELADIFRAYGDRLPGLSAEQRRVVRAITSCRTAALGGHAQVCERCGYREIFYNSCRDRHCPKCQGLDEARWVQARKAEILPVEYFHVVFTIPDELTPIFQADARAAYSLLFAAVAQTLLEVAANPRNLGARIGFVAVLHTWTQQLAYHPHLHCIVPGGGLAPNEERFVSCKPGFFLPVRVLSAVFRGKLLSMLDDALRRSTLAPPGAQDPHALLRAAARKDWVVYSKPPVAGPDQVIAYLARYTHRVAISNDRLVLIDDGRVTFRWKDRAHHDRPRLLTLDAVSFLQRFLRHVLPRGFVRIRYYGLLANGARAKRLSKCRELLRVPPAPPSQAQRQTWQELLLRLTGKDVTRCPRCRVGRLARAEVIPAAAVRWAIPGAGATA
jgi:hypothetical protein